MDNEPRPANPETLHSVLAAARSFLDTEGFALDQRTVHIPIELVEDYDLTEVSVRWSESADAFICHVQRPPGPETPVRLTEYQIFLDGTVKHVSIDEDYREEELDALDIRELTEAEWLDEVVRLDMEGVLDEGEERKRAQGALSHIDETVWRTIEARSLLNSSVTDEERAEAEGLIDAIRQELDDKQRRASLASDQGDTLPEELNEYDEYFRRLLDTQWAAIIAKARAINRGIRSASEQLRANSLVDGSTIDEAEAWDLLRTFDRVADL